MSSFDDPADRLLLVKVDRSLARGVDLYQAVRAAWRLDVRKAETATLVLAIAHNEVVGVFVPHRWKPATSDEVPLLVENPEGRWAFDGAPARATVAARFMGERLPEHLAWRRGTANPIRYVF